MIGSLALYSTEAYWIGLLKRDRDFFFFFFSIEDKWTATNSQCRAHRVVLNCAASHRREQVRSSGFHPGFLPADGATDLRRAYVPTSVAPTWFAVFIPRVGKRKAAAVRGGVHTPLPSPAQRNAATPSVNYSLSMFRSSKPSQAPARLRPHGASH